MLADDESPVFLVPALALASSLWMDEDKVSNVFRTGEGIAWGDYHHHLFCGSESLFRPGYKAHLTTAWIVVLDGVSEKLDAGGKVADVGCGHGASSIIYCYGAGVPERKLDVAKIKHPYQQVGYVLSGS